MSISEVRNPTPPESAYQKSLVKDMLQAVPRALQILWLWVGEQARAPRDRLKAVSCSDPELLARATHWPGPRFRAIAKLSHPHLHDQTVVASAWVSLQDPAPACWVDWGDWGPAACWTPGSLIEDGWARYGDLGKRRAQRLRAASSAGTGHWSED